MARKRMRKPAKRRTKKPEMKEMLPERSYKCRFCLGDLPEKRRVLYSEKYDGYFCRLSHFYALVYDSPSAGAVRALEELAGPIKEMQELARVILAAVNHPDCTGLTGDPFGCAAELAGKVLNLDSLL